MTEGPAGWQPHEGSSLRYKVKIRFGEEPDTMPAGWKMGRVSAVAVDSEGLVYVFHRGEKADPVLVFDGEGRYVRSWGRGLFPLPHGLRIDAEGTLWATDCRLHQVFRMDRKGKVLMTLGTAGVAGCGEDSFNMPTDVAFGPDGGFFVTDGYGNSRVVSYGPDGRRRGEWGRRGTGPGEFHFPHAAAVDASGRLLVSDRENNRIQVFDAGGRFLFEWTHLGATQGLCMGEPGALWVITHRDNVENITRDTLAGRIMKVDLSTGAVLASTESPGHWISAGRNGELFIASLTGNVFRWIPGWME